MATYARQQELNKMPDNKLMTRVKWGNKLGKYAPWIMGAAMLLLCVVSGGAASALGLGQIGSIAASILVPMGVGKITAKPWGRFVGSWQSDANAGEEIMLKRMAQRDVTEAEAKKQPAAPQAAVLASIPVAAPAVTDEFKQAASTGITTDIVVKKSPLKFKSPSNS